MVFPVALQLYSVRDEMEKDFYGTLKKVKEMGYDGVEFAGLFGEKPEDIRAYLDSVSLKAISAHVPLDEMAADPQKTADTYKAIGCEYIAVPYIPDEKRAGTAGFDKTVEDMKKAGRVLRDNGLQLLYHNHDFEFITINGEYVLDMLYRIIPAEILQTQLDTCWVNVGGENPADFILKYSHRAPVVHLKDFVMAGKSKPQKLYELIGIASDGEKADEEAFAFRPVGYGVQDFPAILAAAEKAGAEWVVVEQDRPDSGNTPMNAARQSLEYLKTINK